MYYKITHLAIIYLWKSINMQKQSLCLIQWLFLLCLGQK